MTLTLHFGTLCLCFLFLSSCAAKKNVAINRNDFDKRTPAQPPLFNSATEKAFRLERQADISVELRSDGSMDINVTERQGDEWGKNPISFHPDQLIRFFDQQPHKNLVVVCFHKQAWPDDVLKQRIESTNQYFFDRGYQRVVIQQFYSSGRGTHSDRRKPVF